MTDPISKNPPNYPPPGSVTNVNLIIDALGWGTQYLFNELHDAVQVFLAGSSIDPAVRPWTQSNFIHLTWDHPDMLLSYYGIVVNFEVAADVLDTRVSYAKFV